MPARRSEKAGRLRARQRRSRPTSSCAAREMLACTLKRSCVTASGRPGRRGRERRIVVARAVADSRTVSYGFASGPASGLVTFWQRFAFMLLIVSRTNVCRFAAISVLSAKRG